MTLPPDIQDPQIAVAIEQIKALRLDFDKLSLDIRNHQSIYLQINEFAAWRFGMEKEIKRINDAAVKPPVWPAVVASISSVMSLLVAGTALIIAMS